MPNFTKNGGLDEVHAIQNGKIIERRHVKN